MIYIVAGVILALLALVCWWSKRKKFEIKEINIKLGGIGKVKIKPDYHDIRIAHQIWTELVTRKAAIPIDPDHDVIHEIYDSWYKLFGRVRLLIADIPAERIANYDSTKELVHIAVETLNRGLRPHLTKWQAQYRHWHDLERKKNHEMSPQELQKTYPKYDELIKDVTKVNSLLIEYAEELKNLRS